MDRLESFEKVFREYYKPLYNYVYMQLLHRQDAEDGVTNLVFDLEKLTYITSAGLRVLSVAQKVMKQQGHLSIIHSQPDVMEVFDVTGLTDVMEIS